MARKFVTDLKGEDRRIAAEGFYQRAEEMMRKGNPHIAMRLHKVAAELGHSDSLWIVGVEYITRTLSPFTTSYRKKGVELIKQSARKGNPWGRIALGDAYATGIGGLEKSFSKARRQWLKATEFIEPKDDREYESGKVAAAHAANKIFRHQKNKPRVGTLYFNY